MDGKQWDSLAKYYTFESLRYVAIEVQSMGHFEEVAKVDKADRRSYRYFDLSNALDELSFKKAFGPGILAALFYGFISGSMSFANKIVLTSLDYHFPNVLMLVQAIAISITLEVCRLNGWCNIPKYTVGRAKPFFLPALCYALHTTLALRALDDLSIPMYNILRRMLPLASLLFACFMLKKRPSPMVVLSVLLVVMGCIIAGMGDLQLTSHHRGYICALMSVICQAFYLTFIQKTGVEKGLSVLEVLQLNNMNCIPLLFLYTVANSELNTALYYDRYQEPEVVVALFLVVTVGGLLSFSLFLCATMNSALTTSLVGVVKGVITTIIGFFTFGGVPITFLIVAGIVLNTIGGGIYSFTKYQERMANEINRHFVDHTLDVGTPKSNKLRDLEECRG